MPSSSVGVDVGDALVAEDRPGELEPAGGPLEHQHLAGALQPRERRVGGADRARADHDHGVVEPDADVLVAADHVRQRVGERGVRGRQPVRDAEEVLERDVRDRHPVRVGAGMVEAHQLAVAGRGSRRRRGTSGSAPHHSVEMQWTASPSAMPLMATSSSARGPISTTSPEISWPSTHGRLDPAVAVVEGAHVGAADAARQDLQEHAVLGAHGIRGGADLHRAGTVPDRCAHPLLLRRWTGGSVPVVRHLWPRGRVEEREMIEFIFMLTRDDVTLADAREVYASVAGTGVRHVGCKDVGPAGGRSSPALMDDIRVNGHTTWLEVVSETEEATLRVGPRRGRDPPGPPDRRHADRAGAGDPRRHGRALLPLRRARSSAIRACCAARSTSIVADTERARRSASTASTCSPTATTATSRRSCAPSSAPPTCR